MRSIALGLAAVMLGGCVGSLERNAPAPAVYRLTAPQAEAGPAIGADLLILRPVVAPGLRTDRIASSWSGNRIDYYADARWSGELGSVVQGSMVRAFRMNGRLRTVEGEPGRFLATHVLDVEVTQFEADYAAGGGAPVARVTLSVTVARSNDRKALMATTIAGETAAGANTLTAVIAALDDAFGKAAREVVVRASGAIAADLGQPGS